jgi:ribosomal protein S27AE
VELLVKYCPSCGKAGVEGMKFCPKCGQGLTGFDLEEKQTYIHQPEAPLKKGKMKWKSPFIWIIITIVVIVGFVLMPETTITAFIVFLPLAIIAGLVVIIRLLIARRKMRRSMK